jgi:hypothetical protein
MYTLYTLGFVVVEVVVVEVEVVEVVVVEIVVVKVVVVEVEVVKVDVVDGLKWIELSISVDKMMGKVSIDGRVISELDDSGGSVLISGTVIGCVTRVLTSSICFVSAMEVVGGEVILVLAAEKIISLEDMLRKCVYFVYPAWYK